MTPADATRTPADALSTLLAAAAEEGARRALADAAPNGPRMVPIRECRIPYRVALRAIAEGTLPAYRVGRSTFIDRTDEDDWIARAEHRVRPDPWEPEPEQDEIGELIEISRGSRS